MAGSNTEKPTGKTEQKKNVVPTNPKVSKNQIEKAPVVKVETKKEEVVKTETNKEEVKETKSEVKKETKKELPKIKKNFAFVDIRNSPVSTKVGSYICKFLKKKTIPQAIKDLEEVQILRKAVPMKGEIPHRKGKIMSGRFPVRAAKEFVILLKSLEGNANYNNMEEPIISEAIVNKGTTTYGKGGRVQKKRTHIMIKCSEKKLLNKKQGDKK